METNITKNLVIFKKHWNDNDVIIKCLNEHKIQFFYAKGAQKLLSKNRQAINIGSLVEIEYFDKYVKDGAILLKTIHPIFNLDLTKASKNFLQDISLLFSYVREPNKDFFALYSELIFYLNFENEIFILTYLLSKILELSGKKISFNSCIICKSVKGFYAFNLSEGGILCKNHAEFKTSLSLLKNFYYLSFSWNLYLKKAEKSEQKKLFTILKIFLTGY